MWSKDSQGLDSGGIPNDAIIGELSPFDKAYNEAYLKNINNWSSVHAKRFCEEYFQSKIQELEKQNKLLVELIKKADDLADDVHQRKDIGDGLPGRTSFYLGEYISARQALASLKGDG